jgi:cell division protein FtsB
LRWLAVVFVVLIAALQYPLWFGKGGWLAAGALDRQVAAQRAANEKLKLRNDTLEADVRDLKTGSEAIEERARAELGMIKHDEVLFQLQPSGVGARPSVKPAAPAEGAAPSPSAAPSQPAAAPSPSAAPSQPAAAPSPSAASAPPHPPYESSPSAAAASATKPPPPARP